ncbi:MAG TPA: carboxymuconolactone decarboxylase family protein [Thiopseudomonas sp.]|nr:carboxymuconolactone decarboxylase family protein [Thiopseudomonas sp.]
MTHFALLTEETAPDASQPYLQKVTAKNGFLPNLVAVLAHAPTALETYLTVGEINGRSSLSLIEREVIQITAASIHGCEFCVAGHTAITSKQTDLPKTVIAKLQERGHTGDARIDALVSFVRSVIASRGAVSDGELADFINAGFEQAQALEVVLGVSLATLCNFTNNLAKNDINPQLQAFRPGVFQS